ncbi:periplasmic protease [Solibacillus silvestris StLB046]|uniref:Periplasmic protease n=1 Tax=Solibacillus silvestris (strain StLB046) TaxID=1002809 RepID=F2F339_SOLSS|nr:S41 family peptidase [Solibacillus silvestris]BAK17727.1 periplasmic protease [Solibacillus silvestris StLB046]
MLKRRLSAILFFIMCLTVPLTVLGAPLDEAKQIVKENYVGNINGDINRATSIDQLTEMLDSYSAYFTPEEFDEFISGVDLTTVGIGVIIEKVEGGVQISELIDGGSAKNAGLKAGDIITEIDGKPVAELTIDQASSLIKGAANTTVSLTLSREDGTILTKKLTRKAFSLPNVETKLLYGNTGYISLNSFSNDTASLVSKAIRDLKNKGAKSFIFDLQNNGGGYVTAAEQLIGMFPNASYAYKLKETSGTSIVRSMKQSTTFPENTKMLINRYSASSSEMTAAALSDQKAVTLYGETTYGKGSMQAFYELEDGSFLKLTVGHFYGPNGTKINEVGVKPHIKTASEPLFKAHYDTIVSNLKNYKELAALKNVPLNKKFTIKFSAKLAKGFNASSVELVELGADTVKTTHTLSGQQLVVTPAKELTAGKEYAVIIHPKVKNEKGKNLKVGFYLHVTTKK